MTISGALNNAMSGLRATGRAAEVVSSNLSNALTPGYAKRMLELSPSIMGGNGGVRIDGIVRNVDPVLLADRQLASATFGSRSATAGFLDQLETMLGTPDDPNSLSARVADLGNSLITASSRPDAPERLGAAVNSARDLATKINVAASEIQDARTQADRSIDAQVKRLNDALQELEDLNGMITSTFSQGGDAAALHDVRQNLVDEVSEMVPVRTVQRQYGSIALYTTGGSVLLDGSAAEVGFDPVNIVTPYMSEAAGSLSGLTVNGNPVQTGSERGSLRGGTLGAQFAIRDELAPQAQEKLDAVARDLIERFQDPAVDPTLGVGMAGLFTDGGTAFDPLDEVGLSDRISLNALVDPKQGGETWRLRDGIGAATPGNVGDARLLQSLGDALEATRVPGSGGFGTGSYDANDLTASMMSTLAADRKNSDQQLSFASTQLQELTQLELADGVDSDEELRRLILIEQAYAANARIIETVDDMMQTILRI
ncbi:flagellar hook-associated protein FlgK [Ascidiaceihabitans sp.]|uniref:flagellar hook-associated protein FlgK n=1 Tax=Ascidiaceihabitans sp. TaxID=1872644 RepID=UPI0032983905